MILKLRGGIIASTGDAQYFTKVTKTEKIIPPLRGEYSYICDPEYDTESLPPGFITYIIFDKDLNKLSNVINDERYIVVDDSFDYLGTGDVVKIDLKKGKISTLFRASSRDNFLLVTERCNHYCLMCSQPPKKIDDSWLAEDILQAIPLFPKNAEMVGLTGGEPTLLGDDFFKITRLLQSQLPDTYIHILSNGRSFASSAFTRDYAKSTGKNTCVGIPIYSDDPDIHNYIVQAENAFSETVKGILNLKRYGQKVEIRIVITKQNADRLPQLAEFISKNLLFVDHVTFMGLEITGFAKANLDALWIDPVDYQHELTEAVVRLKALKMNVSVFNHQLCTVDPKVWSLCRKSISDWKNEFIDICNDCDVKSECGGFFATSTLKRSSGLKAIKGDLFDA